MATTILVADPDSTTRGLVATVLTREGFHVVTARDPAEANAREVENGPALIVLSTTMAGGAAVEACRNLRVKHAGARIVVLVGIGELEGGDAAALAAQLGCDAVLPRPFRYPAMRDLLTKWGMGPAPRKEARSTPVSFSVPVPEPLRFDFSTVAPPEPPTPDAAPMVPDARAASASLSPAGPLFAPIPVGGALDASLLAALRATPVVTSDVPPVTTVPARAPVPPPAVAVASFGAIALDDVRDTSGASPREGAPDLPDGGPRPAPAPAAVGPAGSLELDLDTISVSPAPSRPAAQGTKTAATGLAPPVAPAVSSGLDALSRRPFFGAATPAASAKPASGAAPPATAPQAVSTAAPVAARLASALQPSPAAETPIDKMGALSSRPASIPVETPRGLVATSSPPVATTDAETGDPKRAVSLPPSLPRTGELRAVPLPRLLFELYVATFSGRLQLRRQGLERTIYVWNGFPGRVDSDRTEESLGRLLVEHGRITPDQYEAALAAATEQRLGEAEALVSTGAIRDQELLDVLRELTEQRLVNSFGWRDGTYAIEPDAHFGDKMVLSQVHPLRSLWRGVREHYDLGSLMTFFGGMRGQYVLATDLFAVHYDSLRLFLRHLDMGRLLDGKTTFEAALRSDDARAMEIAQALYVLLVADMVRASPKPGPAAIVPEQGDDEPAMTAPVDYRTITRLCDEVNREYMRVKESDYFDALRVEVDASTEAVDAAYANVVRPFTLEALPSGLPEDVQRRASEICALLARARSTVRDPALRERYIEAQRTRFAGEAPRTEASSPAASPSFVHSVDLDLDHGADRERETRQLAERAFADAQRLVRAGDFEMAQQKLAVAVRLNGREPGYRVAFAKALLAIKEADPGARQEAATLLQQALQLDPSHVEASYELAKLLVAVGQANAARPYVMRVLQRAPEHREARALLAKIAG